MIRIVGDINFSDGYFDTGFGIGSAIKNGLDPFKNLNRKESDFWIGNFECVCSNISNKKGIYNKQFRIVPEYLSHIKHFDLYGVANNHVMQHGDEAYREMLKYFDNKNIKYVGSKNNKSKTFEHQGKKVGIISFSQRPDNFSENPLYWSLPEYKDIVYEVDKINTCDFRIAYIHWGNEFINYPYIDQRQFAHLLVDSGIDLIIGMHPHILQGLEIYKGKHIFYSLGNFVFNMPWEPTKYSIVVNLDLLNEVRITYDYIKIGKDYTPNYTELVPEKYQLKYLNTLINHSLENEFYYNHVFKNMKEYKKSNYLDIIDSILRFKLKPNYMVDILRDFVKRKIG